MATPRVRTGYTLLELMLVMAVLVMLGAVFYPSLDSSYSYFKVQSAADSIKGAWAQARAKAIEDNIPYRFSLLSNATRYRVAPDSADYWAGGMPDQTDTDNPPLILEGKLAKGIGFSSGSVESASGAEADHDDKSEPATLGGGADWKTVAVFMPNGEARDDVEVTLEMKGAKPLTLKLPALTGTFKTVTGKEEN